MTISTEAQEKRLAELKKLVPTRGMERYPSLLKNLSELPVELQSPAVSSFATGEEVQVQTIISFPPQIHHGSEYVPKQALLFMRGDVIHTLASIWPSQMPQVTYITGSDLLYLKVKLLLLYGHLEIVAQGLDSPSRLCMEFNTVCWNYLSRPLHKLLRCTESDTPMDVIGHSREIQEAFNSLPFKFANGVKLYGLLPGQQIQELVFQPASWKRQFHFFGQALSGNILIMLTTHYMVVIQEELKVNQGWILSYIPRSNIALIQNRHNGSWSELTVQLKRGDQSVEYKLLLKSETVKAWRACWTLHDGQWQDLQEQEA